MCRFIAQTFSVGLSNVNPKCPDDPILEKNLVGIFINFFIFGLWASIFQSIDKKLKGRVAEPAFYGSRGDFQGKKHSWEK